MKKLITYYNKVDKAIASKLERIVNNKEAQVSLQGYETLALAMVMGFEWQETEEGFDFWHDVWVHLKMNSL